MAVAWLQTDNIKWINGFTSRCFQTLKAHYLHHKVNVVFNCFFFSFFQDLSAIGNRISFSWSWQTALSHSTKFWKERVCKIHIQQPVTTTATGSWFGSSTNNSQYRLVQFTMSCPNVSPNLWSEWVSAGGPTLFNFLTFSLIIAFTKQKYSLILG